LTFVALETVCAVVTLRTVAVTVVAESEVVVEPSKRWTALPLQSKLWKKYIHKGYAKISAKWIKM
jgi:hypothetical protein